MSHNERIYGPKCECCLLQVYSTQFLMHLDLSIYGTVGQGKYELTSLNTWRPEQNEAHFADGIFNCIFLNEYHCPLDQIARNLLDSCGAIGEIWVMAWCRTGNRPLRKPLMTQFFYWRHRALLHHNHLKTYILELLKIVTFSDVFVPHDDVIKWKHFPRYCPFVRGIHWWPVNFPHKGQWRGALMYSFICAWINGWVNNREAGDWRHRRAHYDVIVMYTRCLGFNFIIRRQWPFYTDKIWNFLNA